MSLLVAILGGVFLAVVAAEAALCLLEAVGVAMFAWFDQGEDDL